MCDPKKLEEIKASKAKYDEKVAKVLQKMPERRAEFVNTSGIPVNRVYTPLDMADFDYLQKLGLPGQYPYTRAVQPTAYRGRYWTMRQYAGFGSAEETNERYHFLLKSGQTGLSVAFDLPTQIGYDSDHPLAQGEVGKVGVSIDSLADMERLFQGIPLDKVSTSMTINSPCAVLLAMYLAVAEKQGVTPDKLRGTVQNDILKEYSSRGTYIFPPRPSMRLITDIFEFCTKEVPQWNTISISGYHIREAGSTAVQEIAFTLANGIAYVEAAIKAGMKVDEFGPRLSFFFNSHSGFPGRSGQVPGRPPAVGQDHEGALRGPGPPLPDAALPYPDRRLHPDGPAAPEQHHAGGLPGHERRPGRHPVPAHQLLRRGPGPAVARPRCRWPCAPSRSSPMKPMSATPWTPWPVPITWRT